ncbi:hypothetical protein DD238_000302 [Peronospora effusa]|uniref:Uncharacterized protein n=1 Tax=Peronospora effusa TaxID=542832 RepID=A0A3M6VPA2_9STRA|nr:hypothetical protein DD238_000302 [Peronospora effusa]RQM18050.1 hypothetical protein DD237_000441 [Peronospora effusa]
MGTISLNEVSVDCSRTNTYQVPGRNLFVVGFLLQIELVGKIELTDDAKNTFDSGIDEDDLERPPNYRRLFHLNVIIAIGT